MFLRRARKGQTFHHPYLGCREFPARFQLVEEEIEPSFYQGEQERDLGWMLLDIDFEDKLTPRFFRAIMREGVISVPKRPHRLHPLIKGVVGAQSSGAAMVSL